MSIRLLIVDDQAVFRRGFRALLQGEPGIEVVGEAEDGVQAVRLARERGATLVLMDIRMPRMDGLEATRLLAGPGVEDPIDVLVLTTFDIDAYVFGALQNGAAGFLLKDAEPDVVVDAIRTIARGHGLIAPEVTRNLITRFAAVAPPSDPRTALDALSAREQEVLLLVAQGGTNAQIAAALHLEEATVKSHVSRILARLGLRSRVQAVIVAYETGLVTPAGNVRYGSHRA
ncbi:MAG: response regulator transcription factor [Patulibacter sp.]|nr:response regulator transcription factor [Patulibacter sp.]